MFSHLRLRLLLSLCGLLCSFNVFAADDDYWVAFAGGSPPGVTLAGAVGSVNAMVTVGNNLYVAGQFDTVSGVAASNIARWNGSSWSALGTGTNNTISALAVDGSGNVYAGGLFTTAGGVTVNRVAKWNGSAWSALGSGMGLAVNALCFDNSGNLYATGNFTTAGGVAASKIAKWNGSAWGALGSGLDNVGLALVAGAGNDIYVGGAFTTAGGITVNRVAKWNGSAWSALGAGFAQNVLTLAWKSSTSTLLAAGYFNSPSGVVQWNGAVWSAHGSTVTRVPVPALKILKDGSVVYAHDDTTNSAGLLFRSTGGDWVQLGTQANGGKPKALTVAADNTLYLGGTFTSIAAGSKPAYGLGRWTRQRDQDGDGVPDLEDVFPNNTAVSVDNDSDGWADSWNSGCNLACQSGSGVVIDNCPSVNNPAQSDRDADGEGDACDNDTDNDGVVDYADAWPLDASLWQDYDHDGIGDMVDVDDDADGILDVADNCPLRANPGQEDANADSQGDVCEPPALALGGSHSCAITAAGGVKCWGYNGYGQLGDGTTTDRSSPVGVTGLSSGVLAIAAGGGHTCALGQAGAVVCWGYGNSGQLGFGGFSSRQTPVAVTGLGSGVVGIALGNQNTCALTQTGAVLCWGYNANGQLGDGTTTYRSVPVAVSGLSSGVVAIAAGDSHTCAVTQAGAVLCWGYNVNGQLGDGTTTDRLTPVVVSGLSSGVVAIAASGNQTCALTQAGAVQCWGYNVYGQLGDGTTTSRLTPVPVSGLSSGVVGIALGNQNTCALTQAGAVQCWGYNGYGQLGDGTTTTRLTPVAVSGLSSGVVALEVGANHSCALTQAGAVLCWGSNSSGKLGDGTNTSRSVPVMAGFAQSISITTPAPSIGVLGQSFPVAASSSSGLPVTITASGGCSLSGNSVTMISTSPVCTVTYSQAGNFEYRAAPQLSSVTSVDSDGDGTTDALDADDDNDGVPDYLDALPRDASESRDDDADGIGNLMDIDDDNDGILDAADNCPLHSNANQTDSNNDGQGDACGPKLAAGENHSCALNAAGAVECWGRNDKGQLGDGTTTNRFNPVPVSGLSNAVLVAITAGKEHSCALTQAGAVLCWGSNSSGQLGDGTTTNRLTPVVVSGLSSGVVAIAAGDYHTCTVMQVGAVYCWGYNYNGQLGDGTRFTNRLAPVAVSGLNSGVVAISAGLQHSCALTQAGAVQCWGGNDYGQLGDGTLADRLAPVAVLGLSSGVAAIEAGVSHSCALTQAGTVQCWGYNGAGELGDGTTATRLSPVAVSGLSGGVVSIAVGSLHSCAVMQAGAVLCWGDNANRELGSDDLSESLIPVVVINLSSGVMSVAAGSVHNCVSMTSGGMRCWGNSYYGQLGGGDPANQQAPVVSVTWAQTISVTTPAPSLGVLGESFLVAAVSSSGLPVTITASGGCSVSGNTVTMNSASPFCTLTYSQSGDEHYMAAVQLSSITSVDTDGDGVANASDTDDDNDGFADYLDGMPLDASGAVDNDVDGIDNSMDTDDDGDGVLDVSDNCPLRANPGQEDRNADGQGDACGPPELAAGYAHSCTLTPAGGVQCWGGNNSGQLGDGTTTSTASLKPFGVTGLDSGVLAIASGYAHSCALTQAGAVLCWGSNSSGQLGDGTTTNRLTPVMVSGLSSGVVAIAASGGQTCALNQAGTVLCWGYNGYGQLGDGTTTTRLTPVPVTGLSSGVVAIAASGGHTCALTQVGAVRCWGQNNYGQLGDGTTANRLSPVAVTGLGSGVVGIALGNQNTCALTQTGAVLCWGYNANGQLGDGTATNRAAPVAVSGLSSGAVAIVAGGNHTCALTQAGAVLCWGYNANGQLGDGTYTSRLTAVAVTGLSSGVQSIAAGYEHNCASMVAGGVKCWGRDVNGTPVDVKRSQTISVTLPAPSLGVLGESFTVAAVSSSGLPVAITASGGCSISGNSVTMISDASYCTLTYFQAGNAAYEWVWADALTSITSVDSDGDGIPNASDTDDDNDGVLDESDALPRNASEQIDSDDDGIGDNAELDDDDDGLLDVDDPRPTLAGDHYFDTTFNGTGYFGGSGALRDMVEQTETGALFIGDDSAIYRLTNEGSVDAAFSPIAKTGASAGPILYRNGTLQVGTGSYWSCCHDTFGSGSVYSVDMNGAFLSSLGFDLPVNGLAGLPDGSMLVHSSDTYGSDGGSPRLTHVNPDNTVDWVSGNASYYSPKDIQALGDGFAISADHDDVLTKFDLATGKLDQGFNVLYAQAFRVLPNHQFLTAYGYYWDDGADEFYNEISVQRRGSDGEVDTSFAEAGQLVTPIPFGRVLGVESIVSIENGGFVVVASVELNAQPQLAVLRYNSDGTLDTAFDNDGIAVIQLPGGIGSSGEVILRADGKLVVSGNRGGGYVILRLAIFEQPASGNTITVTQPAPASAAYGSSFNVAATASSGLPVGVAVSGSCSLSGNTVTMTSGSLACTVYYTQAGDENYAAARLVTSSTTATKAGNAITVTQAAPASAAYNSTFSVAATASSGSPVNVAVSGGCSISGSTVTMTSGTTACTVNYNQAGNSNYAAAAQVSSSTTATKAGNAITVTQSAPASAAYNSTFSVAATASSGLPVTITTAGGCTISGNTVTMTSSTAACTVNYSQVGDANYAAAASVTSTTSAIDTDGDGDGVPDSEDTFPNDPAEWKDSDQDGIGDNRDPDDDNDGTPDVIDPDPLNPAVHEMPWPLQGVYKGSAVMESAKQ